MFGINYEAIPQQVNFIPDEAGDCANAVVSQLHYFFSTTTALERSTPSSTQTTAVDKTEIVV